MTTTTKKVPRRMLKVADLFCGAGGTSRGAIEGAEAEGWGIELTGINHWDVAIATFGHNHQGHRGLLTNVNTVNPRDLYQPGELGVLWASPECTHHSNARGGKPINEQSRATAWCVLNWASALQPPVILVENVAEFVTWGGLCNDGRPLKAKRGKTFAAWIAGLESLGYRVAWKILCAADYGDPTTRERLIVQAVRGKRRICWPEPTHAAPAETTGDMLRGALKPYRTARNSVIDWTIKGQLLTDRKRPLAPKTMSRILTGFFKQLREKGFEPYIVPNFGERPGQTPRSHDVDAPLPTVTSHGAGAIVEPFLTAFQGDHKGRKDGAKRTRSIDEPLPTATTENRFGLAEAFMLELRGTRPDQLRATSRSADKPLPAMTAGGIHSALIEVEPFVLPNDGPRMQYENPARSVDKPLGTVTASRGAGALVEPFVAEIDHQTNGNGTRGVDEPLSTITTKARHVVAEPLLVQICHGNGKCGPKGDGRRSRSVDMPVPTVTGSGEWALLEPMILPQQSGGAARKVSRPVPTVSTEGAIALVEPYTVKFYGNDKTGQSVDSPLDTVTTKDRHALVLPVVTIGKDRYLVNFRFRMLQPHELAAAQGFPAGYHFTGNKGQQVKQIGNAVPCGLSKALFRAVLKQDPYASH